MALILVRQASSVRNTRSSGNRHLSVYKKQSVWGMEEKDTSEFDRPGQGKRHLAVATPCPGTYLWGVESLSHTSPLICISTLPGTQLFLTSHELLAAHSSYPFPAPLASSSGGGGSLSIPQWCQHDFPFFNSSSATIMGQRLPRKRRMRVQLYVCKNLTPFLKQVHSALL